MVFLWFQTQENRKKTRRKPKENPRKPEENQKKTKRNPHGETVSWILNSLRRNVPPTWRRHSRRERQETKEIEGWCKNDPGPHENTDPKRKSFPINKREKERKERKTNKRIEEKQQLKPLGGKYLSWLPPPFSRRNLFHSDTASGENNQGSRAASKAGKVGAAGGDGRRTYSQGRRPCSFQAALFCYTKLSSSGPRMKFSSEVRRSRNNLGLFSNPSIKVTFQ